MRVVIGPIPFIVYLYLQIWVKNLSWLSFMVLCCWNVYFNNILIIFVSSHRHLLTWMKVACSDKLRINWLAMFYDRLVSVHTTFAEVVLGCVSISSNKGTNKTADRSFASCTKHCWPLLVKNMNYSQRWGDRADIQRLSNSINWHATEHLFGCWRAWHLVWCRQVSSAAGWLTDAGLGPRCVHILMSLSWKYLSLWKLFWPVKVTPVCRFTGEKKSLWRN